MWGLIEPLILYSRKHKSALLLFIIGLLILISLVVELAPKQVNDPTVTPPYIEEKKPVQELPKPRISVQPTPLPLVIEDVLSQKDTSEDIPNFNLFSNRLNDLFKAKGLDETLSRNLALKIQESLRGESQEDLDQLILNELGPNATDEEFVTVKELVLKALDQVSETAKASGNYPSALP